MLLTSLFLYVPLISPPLRELIATLQSSLSQVTNDKNELNDRLSTLETQLVVQLTESEHFVDTLKRDMEALREALESEKNKEVIALRTQVKQGEAAVADAIASAGAGRIDQEKINELMQNIYSRMGDIFPTSSAGDSDDEEVQHYTSQDILKRCRKVLKQVTKYLFSLSLHLLSL